MPADRADRPWGGPSDASYGRRRRRPDRRPVSQPRAAACFTRRRSWGFPIAPFAGLIPPAGAGDVSRLAALLRPPSVPGGPTYRWRRLRPRWFSPGGPTDRFWQDVRATGPSPRPAVRRYGLGRLGPASGLRSRARSAPAAVVYSGGSDPALGFWSSLRDMGEPSDSTRSVSPCVERTCARCSSLTRRRISRSHGRAPGAAARVGVEVRFAWRGSAKTRAVASLRAPLPVPVPLVGLVGARAQSCGNQFRWVRPAAADFPSAC
jgi:hypothetical protein